jgi:UPF0176 protein
MSTLNIAAYKFVPLHDPPALREHILAQAQQHALKGTVLLAEEGINLFVAGSEPGVHAFIDWLRRDARFADLAVKASRSDTVPFRKLRVKIKREIIRMNHPQIKPADRRAPAVDARTLKRWLDAGRDDEGRELVMLDTRNAFEVRYGAFEGTRHFNIGKFSEFPQAVAAHRKELAGKTVVTFCTGGIRCEKAALYMQEIGVDHVLQLDGGILKYFEEVGRAHYRGECFVFDEREALTTSLAPREAAKAAAEKIDLTYTY